MSAGPAYGVPGTSWSHDKSVFLQEIGPNRTEVVKIVRDLTGKGLADALALVKTSPCLLVDNYHPIDAERLVKKLKDVGAHAEVGIASNFVLSSLVAYQNLVADMNKLGGELRVALSATITHVLNEGDVKKATAFLDKIPNPSALHFALWSIVRTYNEEAKLPEEP